MRRARAYHAPVNGITEVHDCFGDWKISEQGGLDEHDERACRVDPVAILGIANFLFAKIPVKRKTVPSDVMAGIDMNFHKTGAPEIAVADRRNQRR